MSSPKGASTRWIFVCLTHVLTLLLETLGSPLLADHYRGRLLIMVAEIILKRF